MILPLCSALVTYIWKYRAQFWAHQSKADMCTLEEVQQRARKMTEGTEYYSQKEVLRKAGFFSLKRLYEVY